MSSNKKNTRVVYSTNPDYQYEEEGQEEMLTLPPSQQKLYLSLDKKQRKGKKVTLLTGFVGNGERFFRNSIVHRNFPYFPDIGLGTNFGC